MAVITISRQFGSLGDELASYLADKLGCNVIDRMTVLEEFYEDISSDERAALKDSAKTFLREFKDGKTYKDVLIEKILEMTESGNLIVLGEGGCVILEDDEDAIHIRVTASEELRRIRTSRMLNMEMEETKNFISYSDKRRKRFVSTLYERDLADPSLFDLTFNTDNLSVEECADAVLALIKKRANRRAIEAQTRTDDSINHQTSAPVYKNSTEKEFAQILDAYNIEWMYEPKTFPIEWDESGNITMAFSPDFYLPKFNLYLELTTMDQKYVTKKNKKARKVMELYPGTNVKIVYKKDFEELVSRLKRFGGS